MWTALTVTLLLFAACWLSSLGNPRVTIDQGVLKGKILKARGGRDILSFQGIPYAKPPVGDLRFKDPQEPDSWNGERPAHREGNECSQIHFILRKYTGIEDCLYINVYTPKLEREGDGLSVMVWIHGGAFYAGSGNTDAYGPEFLLDHDVVLVTFNYRLGPLGFLNLGTSDVPGNFGMKDQVAALRWVKKNVDKFGGNPESVTIFGESAGGASVHFLMLSPMARGLFHRAILQSGSAHNPWALQEDAADVGLELVNRIGCKQDRISELLACLRTIDNKKFAELAIKMQQEKNGLTLFVPSVEPTGTEGAFLTDDPRSMLARGEIYDVPMMAGVMTHEGMLRLFLLKDKTAEQDYIANHDHYIPTKELGLEPKSPEWTAAWLRIENFYSRLGDGEFIEQYLLLSSDVDFNLGVDDVVRKVAALHRSPVFYYKFSYDGDMSLLKRIARINRKGTCHADDLPYLFTQALLPWKRAAKSDLLTVDRITKLWTDFARTGTPTPDDSNLEVQWKPVEAPMGQPEKALTRYLNIGASLVMKNKRMNGARIAFWQELYSLYNSRVAHEEL